MSRGDPKSITRAQRRAFADRLAVLPNHEDRRQAVRNRMAAEGVQARYTGSGGGLYTLRLLGRTATCTSSANGAIDNWIAATIREW